MSTKTKELVEVLDLVLGGVSVVLEAKKDGKVDFADLPLLMKLVPDVVSAVEGIGEVPAELAALDEATGAEVVAHVVAKLAIADGHAKDVVEKGLKALNAIYQLVKVLKAA